ncbi:hypothetical protein [Mycolicibacterium sp. HS_4_1]
MSTPERDGIIDYLIQVVGPAPGWLCIAVGVKPYRKNFRKFRFLRWIEQPVRWPDEAHGLVTFLRDTSEQLDCYVCPYVLSGPRRVKHTSVAPDKVHADVDDGQLDVEKVRRIPGGCAVSSGSPGNGHVYVLMTRPVPHHQHEQLCRALMAHFGAKDAKVSDNDVLRPPGTFNRKPTVGRGEALPVVWAVKPDGVRIDPEKLAGLLGIELADGPMTVVHKAEKRDISGGFDAAVTPPEEPFEPNRFPAVRQALATVSADRSADTMRVVRACYRSGLTLGQTRWAVRQRNDLAARLAQRHDDDVARCWRVCRER